MINLIEYLQYNSETGVLIWIKSPAHTIKVGTRAGYNSGHGYLKIGFKGKLYYAHRLAWYLHYGKWPINNIDHINGIRNDNRISNLRDITQQQNSLNQKNHRNKTYKYYGYHKASKLWRVRLYINNECKYFKTEKLARQFVKNNINLFRRS